MVLLDKRCKRRSGEGEPNFAKGFSLKGTPENRSRDSSVKSEVRPSEDASLRPRSMRSRRGRWQGCNRSRARRGRWPPPPFRDIQTSALPLTTSCEMNVCESARSEDHPNRTGPPPSSMKSCGYAAPLAECVDPFPPQPTTQCHQRVRHILRVHVRFHTHSSSLSTAQNASPLPQPATRALLASTTRSRLVAKLGKGLQLSS